MKITIENCRNAPKWVTLEKMLKEVTGDPAGHFTKIDRADGMVDYRAPGEFNLAWAKDWIGDTSLPITLVCIPVGKSSV